MTPSRRTRRLLVGGTVALALAVSGCTDDRDPAPGPQPTPSSSTVAPAAAARAPRLAAAELLGGQRVHSLTGYLPLVPRGCGPDDAELGLVAVAVGTDDADASGLAAHTVAVHSLPEGLGAAQLLGHLAGCAGPSDLEGLVLSWQQVQAGERLAGQLSGQEPASSIDVVAVVVGDVLLTQWTRAGVQPDEQAAERVAAALADDVDPEVVLPQLDPAVVLGAEAATRPQAELGDGQQALGDWTVRAVDLVLDDEVLAVWLALRNDADVPREPAEHLQVSLRAGSQTAAPSACPYGVGTTFQQLGRLAAAEHAETLVCFARDELPAVIPASATVALVVSDHQGQVVLEMAVG